MTEPASRAPQDPHAPLRDDVRMLGEILGSTIREQDGQAVFDRIEEIRKLAKSARSGNGANRDQMIAILSSLPDSDLLPTARAFSQFLNLANIAEQHHRIRRRRSYQRQAEAGPQPGSLDELLGRLIAQGIPKQQIAAAIATLDIEFVLTAHPTEVSRRTVIRKYDTIAEVLAKLDHDDLTPDEREAELERLRSTIVALWHTDEIRHRKPAPVDEAEWGLGLVEQVLWDAVPRYLREVDAACRKYLGIALSADRSPIRFASWMGGDRDGNPAVTATVSKEVILRSRRLAAVLYLREVEALAAELSMTTCSEELRAIVGDAHEPYRVVLAEVARQLAATIQWVDARLAGEQAEDAGICLETDQIRLPLQLCYRSLIACNMAAIANGAVLDLLRRLTCFGVSLLRIDIRQAAHLHAQAIDEITQHHGPGSYLKWNEDERTSFLLRELNSAHKLEFRSIPASAEVREVLATFTFLAEQCSASLGAYVVSMASQASDILAVMYLQRLAGVKSPMRVVPLFETLDDLNRAGDVLHRLLELEFYRSAVGNSVEVMIGYSDSAKDAGFLAASWAEYRAQEDLISVCRKFGVRLTLFHGRGGSISRGGAPAHAAILSGPPNSVEGSIRVTEQGEMIRYKFGLPGIAIRTLEVYTAATLEATLVPPKAPKLSWRRFMNDAAEVSTRHYRSVVREDPRFAEYFFSTTPLLELQKLAIGSRPARRTPATDIESLRAIPWVFAWTQVRLMLPVWLGVAQSLAEAINKGQADLVTDMAANWPFFRAMLDMLEMVLAKAEPAVTAYYEQRLTRAEIHQLGASLRRRLTDTATLITQITGHRELLENYPVIRRSINVRNPYTDPLNLLQAEIMYRYRRTPESQRDLLEHALMVTITGIAAGMRNAG